MFHRREPKLKNIMKSKVRAVVGQCMSNDDFTYILHKRMSLKNAVKNKVRTFIWSMHEQRQVHLQAGSFLLIGLPV